MCKFRECIRGRVLMGLLSIAIVFAFAAAVPAFAQEPIMDEKEAGTAMLAETVASSVMVLVDNFGCDPMASVNYSGQVRSDGWSVAIGGNYTGRPLALNYTASFFDVFFDVSGSGSFGDMPWVVDSARAAFSNSREMVVFNAQGSIGGISFFDWVWIKDWFVVRGALLDDGRGVITILGRPIAKWYERSFLRRGIPPFRHRLYKPRRIPRGCNMVVEGTGTPSGDALDINGAVTVSLP